MLTGVSVLVFIAFLLCVTGMIVSSLRARPGATTISRGLLSTLRQRPQFNLPLKGRRGPRAQQEFTTQPSNPPVNSSNSNLQAPATQPRSGRQTYREMLRDRSRQQGKNDSTI